ncbi:MAG: M48 family metallopeptidase [Acidimicrobiales bacterium]|jgi:predicted metal-dependent hydrolase|nr:M48 family metallopeptidase [Acidimicrobiales bacterium]
MARPPRRPPRRPPARPRGPARTEVVELEVDGTPVRLIRSSRRRRSIQAVLTTSGVEVRVPEGLDPEEERRSVADLVARLHRRHRSETVDLAERAAALARRHDLPVPTSIRWVGNQTRRWGSCSPDTGEIRISDRLAPWPPWVLDYVIVHELAHLVHGDHGPAFQALVDRYPLAERARGFLIAMTYDAPGGGADDGPGNGTDVD